MLSTTLRQWLDDNAEALDLGSLDSAAILPRLVTDGLLGYGVEQHYGGRGGDCCDALEAVAQVAERSLTAAFVFWGQRSFIEFLRHSSNAELAQRLLPALLNGELAGASGLSNAMKFLSGIEALGVQARDTDDGWQLNGRLPWITNLRKEGFVAAAAIEQPGAAPFIAALPSGLDGLQRSDDLQLLGLQASNTAALDLQDVSLSRDWLIAENAGEFLPRVRPSFLGLQCAMSIGLARRSLHEVEERLQSHRSVLETEFRSLRQEQQRIESALKSGLQDKRFVHEPVELFRLCIALAEQVLRAVQLELQASGGRAYLQPLGDGFARRLRESAFIPVVTPSLVQLRGELNKYGWAAA